MLRSTLTLFTGCLLLAAAAQTSSPVALQLEQVATGLTRITDISHADDDRLFLTLQAGNIRILDAGGTLVTTPFLNITDRVNDSGNEQGLLGLAFAPDYATSGFFYVHYTAGTGSGQSRVSRFSVTADPNVADPTSEEILYTWPQPYSNHNGGDLDFGADGMLYVGFGDGGSGGDPQNHAQNLSDPLGDMIRIDVSDPDTTYTIPPSNPYADAVQDTLPEIWASGLRNPFRFGFDAQTGDLWIGDVGQNAYEEVDFWLAGDNSGANFGWRCYEGVTVYDDSGCEALSAYDGPASVHQQSAQGWCSVIGGRVYRGDIFWRIAGRYVYTDYCGGQYYTLVSDGLGGWTRTQLLNSALSGFSCIGENSALELYAGNNNNGRLYKIKELCTDTIPVVSVDANTLTSTPATTYQWYLNGTVIAGATAQTHTAVVSGNYAVLAGFGGGCLLASSATPVSIMGVDGIEASDITIQPVPASDVLRIDGLVGTGLEVSLMDAAGRTAVRTTTTSAGTVTVPVTALANGTYTVLVRNATGAVIVRRPVVVQH